ncbi:MAG: hypothetical protein WDN72_08120 [Alphaproteobacteria bacterium]
MCSTWPLGVTWDTQNANFNFTGAGAVIAGTLNAGTGNITITDTFNHTNGGGIILNSGADLIGSTVTLHSNVPVGFGAQIRLNSGSQINASVNTVLQDDSNYSAMWLVGTAQSGVVLIAAATITSPLLTIQNVTGEFTDNGATINTLPSNITISGGLFNLPSGITWNTQNSDFNFTGIGAIIAGTLNAGTGNITITDTYNHSNGGGIILNSGADLIGGIITLHSNAAPWGAQIRLNSGSQINASANTILRDDSNLQANDGNGVAGVLMNSGASITSPLLTVQTAGSELTYGGTTLNISGSTAFERAGATGIKIAANVSLPSLILREDTAPVFSNSATVTTAGNLTIAPYASNTMGVGPTSGSTLNIADSLFASLIAGSYTFGATTTVAGATNSGLLTVNTGHDFGDESVTFVSGGNIASPGR